MGARGLRNGSNYSEMAVVGGGPGGALAALLLARRGLHVTLFDRACFPRWKVCGCCLGAQAQSTLQRCGLGDLLDHLGASEVPRAEFRIFGKKLEVATNQMRALSRNILDDALLRAAASAGAELRLGTSVIGVDATGEDGLQLSLRSGAGKCSFRAKLLVAACGLSAVRGAGSAFISERSPIGAGVQLAGCALDVPENTLMMFCGSPGYFGLVRHREGVSAAASLRPRQLKAAGSVNSAIASLLEENRMGGMENLVQARWRGTPPLRRRQTEAVPGVFHIGDALGYYEPITGQGIGWAMEDAVEVRDYVVSALKADRRSASEGWHRASGDRYRKRTRLCAAVTGLLHFGFAARLAAGSAAVLPAVMQRLAQGITGLERSPAGGDFGAVDQSY